MKNAVFFCLVILVLSFSAFAQSKADEQIISVAKQMAEAQQNYDPATLDKIYASDYIEISPKGEIDEREKAIGFYKVENAEQARAKTPRYIVDEFNVRNYGKFAIAIARFSFGSKADTQKPPTVAGRVVYALRKEKGAWKIYSAQFTPIPLPKPQPANSGYKSLFGETRHWGRILISGKRTAPASGFEVRNFYEVWLCTKSQKP